jgi:hypothetical protein
MSINIVESDKGRRRIRPFGVAALLAACVLSFMGIPALIFWLAIGDAHLVSSTLGLGFGLTCTVFTLLLGHALRAPLKDLPKAAVAGIDD